MFGYSVHGNLPGLGIRWTTDRIPDVVRTLLFVLKDIAFELPDQVKEISETIVELVLSVDCERILTAIHTKPLRALPFAARVGIVEAIRCFISLDPPSPNSVLSGELLQSAAFPRGARAGRLRGGWSTYEPCPAATKQY